MARGKKSTAQLRRDAARRAGFLTAEEEPSPTSDAPSALRSALGRLAAAKLHGASPAKVRALTARVEGLRAQRAYVRRLLEKQGVRAIGDPVERARQVSREAMPGAVAVVAFIAQADAGASRQDRLQAARLLGEWNRLAEGAGRERDPMALDPARRVSAGELGAFLMEAGKRLRALQAAQPIDAVPVSSSVADSQSAGQAGQVLGELGAGLPLSLPVGGGLAAAAGEGAGAAGEGAAAPGPAGPPDA